jgi:hypothetical protein
MNIPARDGHRPWLPGAVLLVAAAVAAGLTGLAFGIRAWPAYAGLAALVLLAMGAIERLWTARQAPPPPKARSRMKVIRGGKAEYDLAADETTNNQRYLM